MDPMCDFEKLGGLHSEWSFFGYPAVKKKTRDVLESFFFWKSTRAQTHCLARFFVVGCAVFNAQRSLFDNTSSIN